MNEKPAAYFGKREASMMAGIGIIMMLVHHFVCWPDSAVTWGNLIPRIGGWSVAYFFGRIGQFCVTIFAFTSGYALWLHRQDYRSFRNRMKRLARFLLCFWIVWLFYLVYGLIVGDPLPSGWRKIPQLMLGMLLRPSQPYVNPVFAWYVQYYVMFILLSPLLLRLYSGRVAWRDALVTVLIVVVRHAVVDWVGTLPPVPLLPKLSLSLWPLDVSVAGLVVAKYALFDRFDRTAGRKMRWWMPATVLTVLLLARYKLLIFRFYWGGVPDMLCSTVFIYCCVWLLRRADSGWLERILLVLGANSMNIWYLHGIFFTVSRPLEPLLYAPYYMILIVVWGIVLCLPVSWLLSRVQRYAIRVLHLQ